MDVRHRWFDGLLHDGGGVAFLLRDVKRPQGQNGLYTPKYIYLVDKSD
jgi:hypothetical protein